MFHMPCGRCRLGRQMRSMMITAVEDEDDHVLDVVNRIVAEIDKKKVVSF